VKILLFGRDGQLGHYLKNDLRNLGEVTAYARSDVDLTDIDVVRNTIVSQRPDVVVNAAAYTAVDQAEADEATAFRVNAGAPAAMAAAAQATHALLVHYSTDYVFDGRARIPYAETVPTQPLGVYGRSKLAGEEAVRAAAPLHLILRTAWLYSPQGKNFFKTMLRLAAERDELRVVGDQIGSPTYAALVSAATVQAVAQVLQSKQPGQYSGTYHLTCGGAVSWHGFAREIMALAGKTQVRVQEIGTADYPTPAARPAYSVLDNSKFATTFGLRLPPWEAALRQCMMEHASATRP
jgi:dTDP-4-dehydrorhamnose reductase